MPPQVLPLLADTERDTLTRGKGTMAAQKANHSSAVPEILALLSDLPIVTSVTIQGPGTHGGIHIIVRKAAQQRERSTQYRYAWEARGGADQHAWGRAEGPAYESAAAAYQAAVEVVQVVEAARRSRQPDQS